MSKKLLQPKFEVVDWKDSIEEILSALITIFMLQENDFEILMENPKCSMTDKYKDSLRECYSILYQYRSYFHKSNFKDRMEFLVLAKRFGEMK